VSREGPGDLCATTDSRLEFRESRLDCNRLLIFSVIDLEV